MTHWREEWDEWVGCIRKHSEENVMYKRGPEGNNILLMDVHVRELEASCVAHVARRIKELEERLMLYAKRLEERITENHVLESRLALYEKVAMYAEHTPNCGYTFDHATQTGEMVGCTCGLETLRAALDALMEGK